MEPLITWRYFLIPEDKFDQIKEMADQLDTLRNRELTEEEDTTKESLIEKINEKAKEIALKTQVYSDDDEGRDGTVVEELVYRMDEAWELHNFKADFYFKFLVYATPQEIQTQKDHIESIFKKIADRDLLKKEFLGKWVYLDRARVIFKHIWDLYHFAFENKCGIIKTDQLIWKETELDREMEKEGITADQEPDNPVVTDEAPETESEQN